MTFFVYMQDIKIGNERLYDLTNGTW